MNRLACHRDRGEQSWGGGGGLEIGGFMPCNAAQNIFPQCLLVITQVHPCQKQPLLANTDQNSHTPIQLRTDQILREQRLQEQHRLQLDFIQSGTLPLFITNKIKCWECKAALTSQSTETKSTENQCTIKLLPNLHFLAVDSTSIPYKVCPITLLM